MIGMGVTFLSAALVLATAIFLSPASANAQSGFPTRAVTMVVPFTAGGPLDVVGRIVANAMAQELGRPIVIANTTGAGGSIGAASVARATPDGHTILLYHIGAAVSPALYRGRLAYDPVNDLAPIGLVNEVPMTLVGRKSLEAQSLAEFVALARAKGNGTNLGNAGIGSASHLCGLLLMSALGHTVTTIPYRGTAAAMNDLIGGQIDVICDLVTNATPQIQAGTIRAYAVSGPGRVAALPDVPTTAEAGLAALDMINWNAMFAPRDTPAPVIGRLVDALQGALRDPAVGARFADLGTQPIELDRATPDALRARLASEIARWTPIIERSGQFSD